MEKIKREDFETWATGNNWLKINEGGSSTGAWATFLSPAGKIVIAQYDLHGNLQLIIKRPPQPQENLPQFPNLRGGGQFPG